MSSGQSARTGNRNASKRLVTTDPAPWDSWTGLTRAQRCIKFIESQCSAPKGVGHGKPLKLATFQKRWIRSVLKRGVRTAVLTLGRGNGKSSLLAAMAVWATFDRQAFDSGDPQVPIAAVTVKQAVRATYGVAVRMVKANPSLSDRAIIYSGFADPRIVSYIDGECFPISHDTDGLQGTDPTLAIVDEIGFQPMESWTALTMAGGKRPVSLVVGVGTRGIDKDNALHHLSSLVHEGAILPGLVFTEYTADPGCDIHDEAQWKKANPALGKFLAVDALRSDVASEPESSFRIFRLNQEVDGYEGWLGVDGSALWKALTDTYKLIDGAPTWVGLDVGLKRDSTAVVAVQYRPDGRLHAVCKLWVPTKEEPVDLTDIMAHLRTLCKTYQVGAISFDKRLFELPAQMLYDSGLPMVEVPQSLERMTPIVGDTRAMLLANGITHDRDDAFAAQITNAIPRLNERGMTLQKSKSRGRIDAAIALCLAVDRATHKTPPRPKLVVLT